jgi:hypothetical protein
MALVTMWEVLAGLDEVKLNLEQAVTTLADMIEDIHPDLGEGLADKLKINFHSPLQNRLGILEVLLDDLAAQV